MCHFETLNAVVLEVWNTQIRPIYCALLFGFEMTHELDEGMVAPLLQETGWFYGVNKVALELISLLELSLEKDESPSIVQDQEEKEFRWPPLEEDVIMKRLLEQSSTDVNKEAIEVHKGVICAIQLSGDLSTLPECVPSYDSLFSKGSLFQHYSQPSKANEYQTDFIKSCVFRMATLFEGPVVVEEDLEGLFSLGRSWGMEKRFVISHFLLSMYEHGKDDMVEDLFLRNSRLVDMPSFLAGAIPLVCVRLNAAVKTLRKTRQCRGILAMLDADTCEWVKEQAESMTGNNINNGSTIPLESTHTLITRMSRMNAVNKIDAYALNGMCETLLSASEKYKKNLNK